MDNGNADTNNYVVYEECYNQGKEGRGMLKNTIPL